MFEFLIVLLSNVSASALFLVVYIYFSILYRLLLPLFPVYCTSRASFTSELIACIRPGAKLLLTATYLQAEFILCVCEVLYENRTM